MMMVFFHSNIPLIPTAKLPSNPVSPSCKASLTSGPQLLLQCNDPLTRGSLQQPPNGSSCLHFPPVHQLSLSFLNKKKITASIKTFLSCDLPHGLSLSRRWSLSHCPQDEVWISQYDMPALCFLTPIFQLWLRRERICLQCGTAGFEPWVGKISWRREWLPTPVFWPREFHGQRGLAGYSSWGHKESKTTEQLLLHFTSNCKSLQQQKSTLPCDSSGQVNVPHFLVSSLTPTTPVFHLIVCKMRVYHYVYSFWFYVYKPVCRTSSASLSSTSSRKPSLTTIYPTEVSHPLGLTINTLFLYPCFFITWLLREGEVS